MTMRVLVTGGAGFIGSHLVSALLERDDVCAIRVLDDLSNGSRANLAHLHDSRLEVYVGSVTDPATVSAAMSEVTHVWHLACLGVRHSLHDPMTNHRVNAEGSLVVLLAARDARVKRYVHVSSSEVYGTAQYAPMDEDHPTTPETVYGGSKLAGEAYARAMYRTYTMPVVVARPFNTYGERSHFEGDSGEVIPRTIVRALCGERPLIFGDGKQTRDLTHVTDTAAGLIALGLSDAAVGRTVNLGSGIETSVLQIAASVAVAVGRKDLFPLHLDERPGDVRRLLADATQMHDLTSWRPLVPFDDGVATLTRWFSSRDQSPQEMLRAIEAQNWHV